MRGHAWLAGLVVVLLAGCAHGHGGTKQAVVGAPAVVPVVHGDAITLYRDATVVYARVAIEVAEGASRITVSTPADVADAGIGVIDRGGLTSAEVMVAVAKAEKKMDPDAEGERQETNVAIVAPRAGKYAIEIAYVTGSIAMRAAYTVTTTAARDRAELEGAIVIANQSGRAYPAMPITVIDADLAPGKTVGDRIAAMAAPNADRPPPRAIGTLAIGMGETRVELVGAGLVQPLHAVLLFDPIGTRLDNPGADPIRMRSLGAAPVAADVWRAYELALDPVVVAGLPEGVATLGERRPDGRIAELGSAVVFGASSRRARVVTIPVGADPTVTGHREQRELTADDGRHRLVEELALAFDNTGDRGAEVVVREHLYRGQEWALVYYSVPAVLEGAQQIAMRITVPPHGHARLTYIVAYPW